VFPRRARLPKSAFTAPLRKRSSSPHFSVAVPDRARGYAVVVSKKTARLSVTRHRLKRRVLGILRTLPLPPALIVYPRASVERLPAPELRAELAALLSKITE
jgi:ribonuclease P protein component